MKAFIRKNVIWKSLSISWQFPKNGKFREIVEIARKFLVTTANFLQGLEIVRLFSNMQLTFAWLHCVTYSFVFLLKWHAFCERAVTGQWTTSSCETKFIQVRWNSDIMWSCWILNFPTREIHCSSFLPTNSSVDNRCPPSLNEPHPGILPPSMSRILPLSMSRIFPPSMNRILPRWTASSLP